MTVRPEWSASDKQRSFINGLLAEREVPATVHDNVAAIVELDDFAKTDATKLIQEFLKLPKKSPSVIGKTPRPTTTAVTVEGVGTTELEALQISRFAIPVSELGAENRRVAGHSDLLFGEVREWKGHRFVNALKGSPGSFSRVRLRGRDKWEVVEILGRDQLRYTQLYGRHYSCCGCCGAELSDETSRKLLLGPECRKRYGY